METTLEVLPVGGRGRRNRKWPDELKARTGRLVLPAPEDPAEFAFRIVGPVDDAPLGKTGAEDRPEIVMGAVVIRLEAGASAERIVLVVRSLEASPVFVKAVVRRFHTASLILGAPISVSGSSQTGPVGCQLRVLRPCICIETGTAGERCAIKPCVTRIWRDEADGAVQVLPVIPVGEGFHPSLGIGLSPVYDKPRIKSG